MFNIVKSCFIVCSFLCCWLDLSCAHRSTNSKVNQYRHLTTETSVSSESELISAVNSGSSIISITSNIFLSRTLNISYHSSIKILGNNFTISPFSSATMNSSCFVVDGEATEVSFENISISGCGIASKLLVVYGGGIHISRGAKVHLKSSRMSSNHGFRGGAIYVGDHSYFTAIDSELSYNYAIENGGAMNVAEDGYAEMESSLMLNNEGGGCGGALAFYYGSGKLTSMTFRGNVVTFEGGGIVMVSSELEVDSCDFYDNYGANSGGIGIFTSSTLNIKDSHLINNEAEIMGGALSISGTESFVNVTRCEINDNISPAGAGISLNGGELIVQDSNMRNNSAYSPSTFSLISGNCSVSNGCFYSGNYPSEYNNNERCVFQPDADGLLDVESFFTEPKLDILTIDGQRFSGFDGPTCVNVSKGTNITWESDGTFNFAGFDICLTEIISGGGAIYIGDGTASCHNSEFEENTATRSGGTFQLNGGVLSLYDCNVVASDWMSLAPINIDVGTFYAIDLMLTGEVEGNGAVTSQCDSRCGVGMIGNCTQAGELAPDCQVNCNCIECEPGYYSIADGASTDTCSACDATKSSYSGSASCDIANTGYYINSEGSSEECPPNAYCAGGEEWPRPNKDFWVDRKSFKKAVKMHSCHRDTCTGSSHSNGSCWLPQCYAAADSIKASSIDDLSFINFDDGYICDESCRPGHDLLCSEGAHGPLCGSCLVGYSYSSSTKTCLKCEVSSMGLDESIIVFSFFCMTALILSVVYFGYDYVSDDLKHYTIFHIVRDVAKALARNSDNGMLRVLWVNYQILDSISWTLEFSFPTPFTQFLDALHFFSFDFFIVDCIPGGYMRSVIVWSSVPLFLSILNQATCQIRIWREYTSFKQHENENEKQTKLKAIRNKHFFYFLLLMFTLLPPVLRRQFVALYCFELQGESYLRIDTSIDCNSKEYQWFLCFDLIAIAVYMMIPVYWIFILHKQKFILNPPATDEQLVYYLRDNDEELQPIRFLFIPYRPGSLYFESFEMYRRIMFIGALPLLSPKTDRRAAIGVFFSLCSLELFRNVEPFRAPAVNLLAYVAQYAVLLTFGAALLLSAGVGDGLSDVTVGVCLLLINISVFGVAATSATLRFLDDKKKEEVLKEVSTKKVEWACNFTKEKFKTTFHAIVQHSVPPSSCLVFWYTDMQSAEQALKSGIPATLITKELGDKNSHQLLGHANAMVGGVFVTLHDPSCLDEEDEKRFPIREVVLACSVPRRWLTSPYNQTATANLKVDTNVSGDIKANNSNGAVSGSASSIRVISSISLQALRTSYFGLIDDSRPWFNGGIFLPPKVIRRAYQLVDVVNAENGTRMLGSQQVVKDTPHHDPFKEDGHQPKAASSLFESFSLKKGERSKGGGLASSSSLLGTSQQISRKSSTRILMKNALDVMVPKTCDELIAAMDRIRVVCSVNGWAPVYHFTQPMLGHMIAKTGFRMSTQGQGDGGVYFSTKGPCSYGLGTDEYESNIIVDCFGESRLQEYIGKHKLDLCIVYGVLPQVLSPAPGGRDNAVMVKKADFEAMTYPHKDGNYFLRPDRILGIFLIGAGELMKGYEDSMESLSLEKKKDIETKNWISKVQEMIDADEVEQHNGLITKKTSKRKKKKKASTMRGGQGHGEDEMEEDEDGFEPDSPLTPLPSGVSSSSSPSSSPSLRPTVPRISSFFSNNNNNTKPKNKDKRVSGGGLSIGSFQHINLMRKDFKLFKPPSAASNDEMMTETLGLNNDVAAASLDGDVELSGDDIGLNLVGVHVEQKSDDHDSFAAAGVAI